MFDVIIVGAGPAGSSAAKESAKRGARTLLIERKKEIGSPVRCGEGIGLHWKDELELNINQKSICANINGAVMFPPDQKHKVIVRNKETRGVVLDRKVFDRDLACEAGRAGAEILIKTEVIDVTKENGRITGVIAESMGEKKRIMGKVVIAADGSESTIARMAGLNSTASLYDSDFAIEYEMVGVECDELIEIYFSREYAPRGYAWVFPKGADIANIGVGIGGLERGHAISYLNKFLRSERFAKAQPVGIKAGMIPVGAPLKKFVLNGFMVVGTAAHQVDPIHGGGICLAMDAGRIAGRVAAECALQGKTDEMHLSEYEKEWRRKREKKLLKRLLLRKVLEKLSDEDMNAIFEYLSDEDIHLVLKGDFSPVVKKVLIRRPQLLKVLGALIT